MSKTIGLFTGVYFNNIGNAFIDIGAEATLIAALTGHEIDFNIVKISQCPFFASSMGPGFKLKENRLIHWLWVKIMAKYAYRLQDRAYAAITSKRVFNLVDFTQLDYLVIPGCVLTIPFIKIFGDVVKRAATRGIKIIFLGASGNFYTDYEVTAVTKYLKELCPYAIMTRDSEAYKYYNNLSKNTFNGIDNVFFVNRMSPAIPKVRTIQEPYVVLNFDDPKHDKIKDALRKKLQAEGTHIVYTNHKPYPYSNIKKCADKGVMCSDQPLDYLFLYRNAEAVYSDRVHACIPTLAFGNNCQLFSDSPRIALFENVGLKKINKELTQANNLTSLQNKQIEYLSSIFK
jgi:hypothetical protein